MTKLSGKVIIFDEIESTQLLAKEYIKNEKSSHGLVIQAKKQVQGKGRLDRSWASPSGGLWLSIILQKKIPLKYFQGFSVRIGLAISESLEELLNLPFRVKWPNDLFLNNKKVGGILVDLSSQEIFLKHLVLGIGLNVNFKLSSLPEELQKTATTVFHESGKEFSLDKIRDVIITTLGAILKQFGKGLLPNITSLWKERSVSFESTVKIRMKEKNIEGIEKGITTNCDLIIETKDRKEIISSGEIEQVLGFMD
ncbi:MAG: biotin--[acetyl-CoA-carboxylase] ligase [Asgard group archaeon]|nr:biotin--[acetyl-CoA-carboxylase] ligase [Asgard group archaeon]